MISFLDMNTKPTTRNKYEKQAQTSKRLQRSPQSLL